MRYSDYLNVRMIVAQAQKVQTHYWDNKSDPDLLRNDLGSGPELRQGQSGHVLSHVLSHVLCHVLSYVLSHVL